MIDRKGHDMKEEKVYVTLQNGQVFEGKRFGANRDVLGELVFTTGMTGYIETLTDPSYYGQIVIQTFPLIGNYGMIRSDCESKKPYLTAYIVREYCETPSNFRCEGTLDEFLKKNDIPGVYGIDTRELTRTVRETGVMNAVISSRPVRDMDAIARYSIVDAVKNCTCEGEMVYECGNAKRTVVLWDFGAKENIARELVKRGCKVIRVPSDCTAERILSYGADGLMLTNGPGDPAENSRVRHLPRTPAVRARHGRQDQKDEIRSPRRQPACQGPADGYGLHFQPEPRLRSACRFHQRRRGTTVHQRKRQYLRRGGLSFHERIYRAVPSRSVRRTFGCDGTV